MEHNQIGNKIRELRMRHNLTQAELGKQVGVSMQAVSKWERGGTPDIGVLLCIAQYFNITIDELLGRSPNNVDNLEDILYNTVLQTPDKSRAELAFRYCWAVLKGMSGIPALGDLEYSTVSIDDTENSRCRIANNGGVGYSVIFQDAHMLAVMPEPKDGFDMLLGKPEEYLDLFRLLSDPDTFQLFLFICTRSQSLFSIELAMQATGISEQKIREVFDIFANHNWLIKENADMDSGTITLYRSECKEFFLFFLIFAHEMIINPRFWYFSSVTKRDKPLLKHMPTEGDPPDSSEGREEEKDGAASHKHHKK